MIPLDHRDTGNRADPYTEPNSCFSDSSDSLNLLNSLNSVKVLLHLEKTPLWSNTDTATCESVKIKNSSSNVYLICSVT